MTLVATALIGILVLWMTAVAYVGFARRYVIFVALLAAALALNMVWMVWGLRAHPFELNALIAQGALTLYGLCAFGAGWFAGRIRLAWRESRVEDA